MNSPACKSDSICSSGASAVEATCLIRASGDSRPITASVCSSSFCSAESRSMREASIPCTVGGSRSCESGRTIFTSPIRCSLPLLPSPPGRLSIFSILGPERAKKLSIGVHGFAENRENRQPPWARARVRAVPDESAIVEQPLHHLLDEERVALGALDYHPLERVEFGAVAQKRRQHLPRAFPPERIQPQLHVVGFVGP